MRNTLVTQAETVKVLISQSRNHCENVPSIGAFAGPKLSQSLHPEAYRAEKKAWVECE